MRPCWLLPTLILGLAIDPSDARIDSHSRPSDFLRGWIEGRAGFDASGRLALGTEERASTVGLAVSRKTPESFPQNPSTLFANSWRGRYILDSSTKGALSVLFEQPGVPPFRAGNLLDADLSDMDWYRGDLYVLLKPPKGSSTSVHLYRLTCSPNGALGPQQLAALAPPGTVLEKLAVVEDRLFVVGREVGEDSRRLFELRGLDSPYPGWFELGSVGSFRSPAWDIQSGGDTLVLYERGVRTVETALIPPAGSPAAWDRFRLEGGDWGQAMNRLFFQLDNRRDRSALLSNRFQLPTRARMKSLDVETLENEPLAIRFRTASMEGGVYEEWSPSFESASIPVDRDAQFLQYEIVHAADRAPVAIKAIRIEWESPYGVSESAPNAAPNWNLGSIESKDSIPSSDFAGLPFESLPGVDRGKRRNDSDTESGSEHEVGEPVSRLDRLAQSLDEALKKDPRGNSSLADPAPPDMSVGAPRNPSDPARLEGQSPRAHFEVDEKGKGRGVLDARFRSNSGDQREEDDKGDGDEGKGKGTEGNGWGVGDVDHAIDAERSGFRESEKWNGGMGNGPGPDSTGRGEQSPPPDNAQETVGEEPHGVEARGGSSSPRPAIVVGPDPYSSRSTSPSSSGKANLSPGRPMVQDPNGNNPSSASEFRNEPPVGAMAPSGGALSSAGEGLPNLPEPTSVDKPRSPDHPAGSEGGGSGEPLSVDGTGEISTTGDSFASRDSERNPSALGHSRSQSAVSMPPIGEPRSRNDHSRESGNPRGQEEPLPPQGTDNLEAPTTPIADDSSGPGTGAVRPDNLPPHGSVGESSGIGPGFSVVDPPFLKDLAGRKPIVVVKPTAASHGGGGSAPTKPWWGWLIVLLLLLLAMLAQRVNRRLAHRSIPSQAPLGVPRFLHPEVWERKKTQETSLENDRAAKSVCEITSPESESLKSLSQSESFPRTRGRIVWQVAEPLPAPMTPAAAFYRNGSVFVVDPHGTICSAKITSDGALCPWGVRMGRLPTTAGACGIVALDHLLVSQTKDRLHVAEIDENGVGEWREAGRAAGIGGRPSLAGKGNRLYLAGGAGERGNLPLVRSIDFHQNGRIERIETQSPLPHGITDGSLVVGDRRIYWVGGRENSSWTGTVFSAPIADNGDLGEWVLEPPLPLGLRRPSIQIWDSALWVVGGNHARNRVFRALLKDGGQLGSWFEIDSEMPDPLEESACLRAGGRFLLLGGRRVGGSSYANREVYWWSPAAT